MEVIFVSGDKTQEAYDEYYKEMPWLAMPFRDERIKQILEKYPIKGVPRLFVFKADGTVIHNDAVKRVSTEGPMAIEEFLQA